MSAPAGRPTVAANSRPEPVTGALTVRTVVELEMMLKSQLVYGSLMVELMATPMEAGAFSAQVPPEETDIRNFVSEPPPGGPHSAAVVSTAAARSARPQAAPRAVLTSPPSAGGTR